MYLGKVNCNLYNCELYINNRVFYLNRVWDPKFRSYKELEITLSNNEEYYIKEEIENETFRDPLIYIINSRTDEKIIRLASYYKQSPEKSDEFVLLDSTKINSLKEHINYLNNNTKRAIENKQREQEEIIKTKKKNFLDSVTKKINTCIQDGAVRTMIYNFIARYSPMFIYKNNKNLKAFETMIHTNLTIGNILNRRHMDTIAFREEEFKSQHTELSDYYNNFSNLVKVIKKRENFNSDDEAMYYTWILFNEEVCHYYHNQFHINYNSHFSNVDSLSFEDCIEIYINLGTINLESSETVCLFTFYLMHLKKVNKNGDFIACYNIVRNKLSEIIKVKQIEDFEAFLLKPPTPSKKSIEDVDLMGGHEFESFIANLFNKMGYKANVTKGSGDQGIDILAEKNGKKYGIQTKCYSNSVSNTAIQEVVAGLRYYNLNKGIVVTNNYFTDSAKELAYSNNVILWDRNILKEKINSI